VLEHEFERSRFRREGRIPVVATGIHMNCLGKMTLDADWTKYRTRNSRRRYAGRTGGTARGGRVPGGAVTQHEGVRDESRSRIRHPMRRHHGIGEAFGRRQRQGIGARVDADAPSLLEARQRDSSRAFCRHAADDSSRATIPAPWAREWTSSGR
jgi:hypothetical protein